jgi:Reverse transcriptase (RNA-dependent DNA polymerase)
MKSAAPVTLSRRQLVAGLAVLGSGGAATLKSAAAALAPLFDGTEGARLEPIALSLRNIMTEGITDVFRQPTEVDLLVKDVQLRNLVALRTLEVIFGEAHPSKCFSPLEFVDVPKRTYGARRTCAVMDTLDAAAYLALVIAIAPTIERYRIAVEERAIFSYRFAPNGGWLFDRNYAHSAFLEAVKALREQNKFMVHCDISQFYPSLSPAIVDDSLQYCKTPGKITERIRELLDFWSHERAAGLPIGSNASRILAEAALIPIDNALRAERINFVRFVDDFCLFADDQATAERALHALQEILTSQKLHLNQEKTIKFAPRKAVSSGSAPLGWEVARPRVPRPEPLPNPYAAMGIPRKSRGATRQEIHRMKRAQKMDVSYFLDGELVAPWLLRRAVRIAAYCNDVKFLRQIPELMMRYPEFSEYIVSLLVHQSVRIEKRTRQEIGDKLSLMLLDRETQTFVALQLLEFLATPAYERRSAIENYARANMAAACGIRLRTALRALRLSGGIPNDISEACLKADASTVRAILFETQISSFSNAARI